jgi:hypothetical protein
VGGGGETHSELLTMQVKEKKQYCPFFIHTTRYSTRACFNMASNDLPVPNLFYVRPVSAERSGGIQIVSTVAELVTTDAKFVTDNTEPICSIDLNN